MHRFSPSLALVLAVLAAACSGPQLAAPTPYPAPVGTPVGTLGAPGSTVSAVSPPAAPDIRRVDVANLTLPGDVCGGGDRFEAPAAGIPLRDGRWNTPGSSYVEVTTPVGYGDVTSDGHDEVVLTVTCGTGASTGYRHVWVYTPDPAAPDGIRRLPAPVEPDFAELGLTGASTAGGTGAITGDALVVTWLTVLPGDPLAGPSKVVTTRQVWDGAAWRAVSPPTVEDRDPEPMDVRTR